MARTTKTAAGRRGKTKGTVAAGTGAIERGLSRRGFLGAGAATSGVAALSGGRAQAATAKAQGPGAVALTLTVNGKARTVKVEPRATLLRVLRNQLDVTGPKEVCDRGACGACSVLVDGKLVSSCMMLALDAAGKSVTSAEGLVGADGKLHPIQEAFCKFDALQCGFCTPGMVIACKALLDQYPKPSREQIRKGLSGNLCRCGTYTSIFAAVEDVAKAGG